MPEEEKIDEKTLALFKKKGYKILNQIGSGSFGIVYKVEILKTGKPGACKVMSLERANNEVRNKYLPQEMAAMIESKHQNVIQLFDIFRSNRRIFIFMEYIPNGDLFQYLTKHGAIPIKKTNIWFRQSCEGLNYLHNTLFIAHRDIKLDNILLDENYHAKLSDFGFAKKCYDNKKDQVILSETFCGTEQYYSPQLVRSERYNPFKADVFAMGVVLFCMINNKYPFTFGDTYKQNKQMENQEHLKDLYIKDFCKHIRHLIRKMFEFQESDRYSIKDVLEHKWIREKLKCCDKSISQSK